MFYLRDKLSLLVSSVQFIFCLFLEFNFLLDSSVPFLFLQGGSWISTGSYGSRFARIAFRRHFFQLCGFRLTRSKELEADLPARAVDTEVFILGAGVEGKISSFFVVVFFFFFVGFFLGKIILISIQRFCFLFIQILHSYNVTAVHYSTSNKCFWAGERLHLEEYHLTMPFCESIVSLNLVESQARL